MDDFMRIVAWDPTGDVVEGHVVTGPNHAADLERRGAVLLPVDSDRVYTAVGGYFRRGWGLGWAYGKMTPERGCPMILRVSPDRPHLYWAARLISSTDMRQPRGIIRLVTDTSRQEGFAGGLSAVENTAIELERLDKPDRMGGWTLRGRSRVTLASEGYLAMNLYGVAEDAIVLWSAISISRQEVSL